MLKPQPLPAPKYPAVQCFLVASSEEADGRPGAMWFEDRVKEWDGFEHPGGQALYVICPNGRVWCIDSRASNCTMKNDNNHRCWIRHGTPPLIVVDKQGKTCQAGAGSIQAGDYHGFLGSQHARGPGWFT